MRAALLLSHLLLHRADHLQHNFILSSHAKEIWYFSPTPTKTSSSAALSLDQLS